MASSSDGLAKGVAFCTNGLEKREHFAEMVLERGSLASCGFGKGLASLVDFLDVRSSVSSYVETGKCYVV